MTTGRRTTAYVPAGEAPVARMNQYVSGMPTTEIANPARPMADSHIAGNTHSNPNAAFGSAMRIRAIATMSTIGMTVTAYSGKRDQGTARPATPPRTTSSTAMPKRPPSVRDAVAMPRKNSTPTTAHSTS